MIKEISNLLLDREYTKGQGIPDVAVELLNKAKSSISTINSKTLSNQSRRIYRESKAKIYDAKLTQLTLVTLNPPPPPAIAIPTRPSSFLIVCSLGFCIVHSANASVQNWMMGRPANEATCYL